uniref:Uncharacterized protein n=1 Tax=Anopheles merus TaxID=30066 RepID=A0A182UV09_ANOME
MNQDEEVPTRVTRGALRRRSVDQEATPQKPAGAATGGTPKKSASTTKKVNALNAIQETEGRPSTPTVGRSTRRRMSETSDTPTILPNKLVQNLKEAEIGAETGRRSRNTSLTEENLNELNAAYEGGSSVMPTRSRTPARLRASNEALASMNSPQPAVRRSTRRNSVTSDDGSVQSLPVTTPKLTSGLRVLKDDTIIEEDASDDRAESVSSEASTRTTRRQSTAAKKSASPSPRRIAESPGIDEFSVRRQEEQERLEEETEKLQKAPLKSPVKPRSPAAKAASADERIDEDNDDEQEDEEEAQDKNELLDDEAVEMEGYESGDSLASDLRREMEENEIMDQGEDLGSEDTEENDEQEEDDEDGNDSWIVSSGDEAEQLNEDELLKDTEDEDLQTKNASLKDEEKTKTPKRRRIIEMVDDSDEDTKASDEERKETAKSPKNLSSKRSLTPSETEEGGECQPDATQNDEVKEAEALVENVEVENGELDDKTQTEPAPAEFTLDQPADEAPTKPGRKSMPAVPLISAQFYIGASKKRATIGGEDAQVQTSTPKPNQTLSGKEKAKKTPVDKKATTANGGSTVLNPFAQAKNKTRLSLDSGAGQQKPEKKDKLRRSLPLQFVEEPMEVDEAPMNENVAEEPSKPDDDKEMNDEVEVVENQEPENGKQQSKAPKPKRKALEDYDLANILSRCNEVIREDKERKKEVASAIRKKKLRVLQRIESGGFFEENVTPDKIRLKRNFGFQERQATPAKQLGFKVSSLLPTDQNELRAVASSSKTHSKDGRMKSKHGGSVLSEPPSRSLPLPVWTSSGVFIESSVDDNGNTDGKQRKQQPGSNQKTDTGYIQLKGQGKADFRLKTLRPGPAAEKPHRVDPSTTEQSVLNFKRKQLLEKTAHLREKKKSNRV